MKKEIVAIAALLGMVITLGAIEANAFQIVSREMIEREIVTEIDLIRTVDNFVILFDSSGSTNQAVPGTTVSKIQATKAFLKARNAWLPDLGFKAGLYEYTNNQVLTGTLKEIYGMQPYDRERFSAAIDQLPETGKGPAMLQAGLSGLRKVVAGLTGRTAVILFTDGKFTVNRGPKRPLQIAQEIARDNDVCFYLVSSATAEANVKLLEAVSRVNPCSRVVPIGLFMEYPLYLGGALFTVRTTSYERIRQTTQVVGFVAPDMLFDFDSAVIRDGYMEKLGMLADYLQKNPDAYVVAAGYTDSTGDEEYNLALSYRRADSIKDHLITIHGIGADRIVTLWYGDLNPVADNGSAQGRQRNRRVEIAVGTGN
jgi:OOP family OmpA-OmpF porin